VSDTALKKICKCLFGCSFIRGSFGQITNLKWKLRAVSCTHAIPTSVHANSSSLLSQNTEHHTRDKSTLPKMDILLRSFPHCSLPRKQATVSYITSSLHTSNSNQTPSCLTLQSRMFLFSSSLIKSWHFIKLYTLHTNFNIILSIPLEVLLLQVSRL
jgi:hypothetical protein